MYFFIKCDIMTELNISNIATASETFVRECDEWCSVAMRKCEVWSYRVLYCLKELQINECHLKIMTKSMFWCTLYMQSDKNINQEYFTETFHVIFWVSVKMIELRWKTNYLIETGHWRYSVREYGEGLKIVKSDDFFSNIPR